MSCSVRLVDELSNRAEYQWNVIIFAHQLIHDFVVSFTVIHWATLVIIAIKIFSKKKKQSKTEDRKDFYL